MRHLRFAHAVATGAVALALMLSQTAPTSAQTPVGHEQHHPGTPASGGSVCAAQATPGAMMGGGNAMTGGSGGMMGTPGAAGMAGMMEQFDLMFIDLMIPHHESAVAMAQVALQRAERPEIKQLAEDIIKSQSAEIDQMRQWRDAWYPNAPAMPMDQMMDMMAGMMDQMPGMMATPGPSGMGAGMMMNMGQEIAALCATTKDFDLAFIDAMITHHESAILMAQVAEQRAAHPELKQLAQAIVAAQQREIDQMRQWRAAWYGATPAA